MITGLKKTHQRTKSSRHWEGGLWLIKASLLRKKLGGGGGPWGWKRKNRVGWGPGCHTPRAAGRGSNNSELGMLEWGDHQHKLRVHTKNQKETKRTRRLMKSPAGGKNKQAKGRPPGPWPPASGGSKKRGGMTKKEKKEQSCPGQKTGGEKRNLRRAKRGGGGERPQIRKLTVTNSQQGKNNLSSQRNRS